MEKQHSTIFYYPMVQYIDVGIKLLVERFEVLAALAAVARLLLRGLAYSHITRASARGAAAIAC
jgi:hypothetical protein